MALFSRAHPYFGLWLSITLTGAKFPFNYWLSGNSEGRIVEMKASKFGLLVDDRKEQPENKPGGVYNAWDRIEDIAPDNRGRKGLKTFTHDYTNLVIEWVDKWGATAVKFLCALFVYFVELPILIGLIYLTYRLVGLFTGS